jgi:multimeric flavodoxin WrbA/putative sterol carrier protein
MDRMTAPNSGKQAPKELKSPYGIMRAIVETLNEHYPRHHRKGNGIIRFDFLHKNRPWPCYIKADEKHLTFHEGTPDTPAEVTLQCSFFHWLDLASGKLNPVWGTLTRKLKFTGRTPFFRTLPRPDFSVHISDKDDPASSFEKHAVKNWTPPRSVILINASPRRSSGYTKPLASCLAEGIREAGANVEEVDLANLKIKTCTGCWQCWIREQGCVFDGRDDFYELFAKVNRADLIVYALPLYVDGMPSILKNYFDRSVRRVYPYMGGDTAKMRHPRRIDRKNQAMAVLSICGFQEKTQFRALDRHFRAIAHNFHIPLVETVYRPGAMFLFNNPFLYKKQTEILESMKKAGTELTLTGKISRKTKRIIEQSLTAKKEFVRMSNYFWFDKITRQKNTGNY